MIIGTLLLCYDLMGREWLTQYGKRVTIVKDNVEQVFVVNNRNSYATFTDINKGYKFTTSLECSIKKE